MSADVRGRSAGTLAFSRMDRSSLGSWWWTVDRQMLGALLVLIVIGIVLIATASPPVAQQIGIPDEYHFLKRHLALLLPSLIIMFVISLLSPRIVWRFASIFLMLSLAAMVAVLFAGTEIKGARRWIDVGFMSLQPSEFVKPAFAVVAAWLIALQKTSINRVKGFKTEISKTGFFREKKVFQGYNFAIILYCIIIILLLKQPDLGMTVVLTIVFATQVFLAGLRFRYVAALLGVGAGGLFTAYFAFHHVKSRIDRFWNPEAGDNYQVEKSIEAIKNGGFFGVGPGQGQVKLRLPDAHADFIVSVLAEEMGFLFVLILMSLYIFIIMRGIKRLSDTGDLFSILAVGGLLTMFGLQAVIHMGSALNVLPAKGMTLPFISYGGSSLIAMAITMGMVLALTRRKQRRSSIARHGMMMRRKTDFPATDNEE